MRSSRVREGILRIFTYIGLVGRRLWAKKSLLVGSFLGATLVTALLAIVPLYESSIAAIDLLFTFREAPSADVDVRASASAVPYDPATAAFNRSIVEERREDIATWFPPPVERTQSRELTFIQIASGTDWLAEAEAWRASADAWAAEVEEITGGTGLAPPDLVALALSGLPENLREFELPPVPTPPHPRPTQEPTVSRLFTSPDIEDELTMLEGTFPEPSAETLQVVLGEDVARLAALGVGDQVILRPFIGAGSTFMVVDVVGIARPADSSDVIWESTARTLPGGRVAGERPGELMFVTPVDFDRWTQQQPINPADDPWYRESRGVGPINGTQTWFFPMDREAIELENVDSLDTGIRSFTSQLGRNGVTVSTGIPAIIDTFDLRSVVFGGPILAMLALVVAGALYFLIYTASLTLEREGPEMALLRTRGASSWQTVGIHIAQSAVIAAAAAVVAPLIARFLVQITGLVPPMSDLTGGEPLEATSGRPLLPFILVGAGLAFVTMGLAILPMARRSVLDLRLLAARPTTTSFWQRYYIDVFFVILAAILLFQLRQRGLVETSLEDPGLDPFAIASPALFLFAGALVLLRVLPWILRGLGWLLTRVRGLGAALPGWHLGRNPVPYGRLALLIWLTTGFGAFALTYAQTLDDSYRDRALFAAGADARVVAPEAGFVDPPADASATAAVYRVRGNLRLVQRSSEMLAVRPQPFAETVAWRSDFGGDPAELFGALRPDGGDYDWGVALPAATTAIEFAGAGVPEPWAVQEERAAAGAEPASPLRLMIRIADARGRLWTFASDELSREEWRTISVPIDSVNALEDVGGARMTEPLWIQAIWLERQTSAADPNPVNEESVVIADIGAVVIDEVTPLTDLIRAEMEPQGGMRITEVAADTPAQAFYSEVPSDAAEPTPSVIASSPLSRPGRAQRIDVPVRTRVNPTPHLRHTAPPVRVLADQESLGLAGLSVGDVTQIGIGPVTVPAEIVGRLSVIPTAFDATTTGAFVIDLDAALDWTNGTPTWSLLGTLAEREAPQELWMRATDPDRAVREVLSVTGEAEVFTASGEEASFSSRPVQIGLVSILFVGAATGVVLALAGVTGYVLIAVRRRTREMGVLRALGFRRSGVAATFALEQLVVMILGAVIGVAAGVGLMRLLVPFLQLGEQAEELVPSVLLAVDVRVLGLYLAVVAGLLLLSVLWATRSVSARNLSEVLREVDR